MTVINVSTPGFRSLLGLSMLAHAQLKCEGSLRDDICQLPGTPEVGSGCRLGRRLRNWMGSLSAPRLTLSTAVKADRRVYGQAGGRVRGPVGGQEVFSRAALRTGGMPGHLLASPSVIVCLPAHMRDTAAHPWLPPPLKRRSWAQLVARAPTARLWCTARWAGTALPHLWAH